MKELILLRGIPGSGKSTLAKSIGGTHLESDMYFVDLITGDYIFNPSKLKEAHEWCQESVLSFMIAGYSKIVVSNTFTQKWEMDPYYKIAKDNGYIVYSLVVENRHNGVNTHNVPKEVLSNMQERFEIKLK
jgi:tRNA uridine 5-carbamoylmethylation protein Kti12